jgi:hypothetical protein
LNLEDSRIRRKIRRRNQLLDSSEETEPVITHESPERANLLNSSEEAEPVITRKSPEKVNLQEKTHPKRKQKKKSKPYVETEDERSDREEFVQKKRLVEEVDDHEFRDGDYEPRRGLPDPRWKTTIGQVPKLDKNGNMVSKKKRNKKKVTNQLHKKTMEQEEPSTPTHNDNHHADSREVEESEIPEEGPPPPSLYTREEWARRFSKGFAGTLTTPSQPRADKEWNEKIAEVQSIIVPNARTSSGLTSEQASVFLGALLLFMTEEERLGFYNSRPPDGNTAGGEDEQVTEGSKEAENKRKSVKHAKSPSKKRRRH